MRYTPAIKKCKLCNSEKPSEEFVVQQRICKECRKVINRNYYVGHNGKDRKRFNPNKNIEIKVPKTRGRPKKIIDENEIKIVKMRGRPKKNIEEIIPILQ